MLLEKHLIETSKKTLLIVKLIHMSVKCLLLVRTNCLCKEQMSHLALDTPNHMHASKAFLSGMWVPESKNKNQFYHMLFKEDYKIKNSEYDILELGNI